MRFLVYVRSMSGIIGPQIWYEDFVGTGLDVVGDKLRLPPDYDSLDLDAVVERVQRIRRANLAAA